MTTQRPCAYTTLSPLGLALNLVLCARAVVGFAANVAEGVSDMVASVHCSRFTALPGGQCVIDTRDRAWHHAGLGRAEIRRVYRDSRDAWSGSVVAGRAEAVPER